MKSMKKILTLLLVAALAGAMATTAYAERPVHTDAIDMEIDVPGPVDVPVGPRVGVGVEGDDLPGAIAVSGGWNFSEEAYNNLTDENRAIFESAVANSYTGTSTFEVVQKVASESVAGANYAYLCKETPAGSEAPTNWSILTVYVDLDGNATLTNVEAIDPENIKTLEEVPPIEPGGWTILQTDKGLVLSEAVANAIMLSGVSYIPAAVLATQVVSGTNYRILAYGKQVTEYTRTDLYVLDVFEGLDGTAEVTILGKESGETVLHTVVHQSPYILLALMPYLVAAYVAQGHIILHFGRVCAFPPIKTREAFMHQYAA